jgi:signal transduction histidine kinase
MVINFKPKGIVLTISDNGKGFIPPSNPADLSNIGHYGLLGIHERAELIGANITIQSGLGHGSKISLQIPM